jgi:hypothetical protein
MTVTDFAIFLKGKFPRRIATDSAISGEDMEMINGVSANFGGNTYLGVA